MPFSRPEYVKLPKPGINAKYPLLTITKPQSQVRLICDTRASARDAIRPAFQPGSHFVRKYHGITHSVEVADDGTFVWIAQHFKSFYHTARAITGYNDSGFKFFGVTP